jgi:hypothetical protein
VSRQEQIRHEHREMRTHLDRIRMQLAAPGGLLSERRARRVWIGEIDRLADELTRHFATEETGGYMSEVIAMRPESSRAAERLVAQHDQLLGRLAAIRGHLAADDLAYGRAELARFLTALEAHERAEVELVQEAFNRDVAAAD